MEKQNNKELEVKAVISQTLSKSVTVKLTDYETADQEDVEPDDEGVFYSFRNYGYSFSSTALNKACKAQHFDIPSLLAILKDYIRKDIKACPEEHKEELDRLHSLEECCSQWILDESETLLDL